MVWYIESHSHSVVDTDCNLLVHVLHANAHFRKQQTITNLSMYEGSRVPQQTAQTNEPCNVPDKAVEVVIPGKQ